ncbi:MAG: SCO family protein [Anaerolineae bacterium]|jgi:protein SCO1/2|nr:SCO family protein [Anaerolineae bacterium]
MTKNKPNSNMIILAVIIPLFLAIAGVVILAVFSNNVQNQTATTDDSVAPLADSEGIAEYNPPRDVQDFTMPASTGEEVSLSDFRGKYVMIAFGYTRCPDVCPINMADFKQVKRFLGQNADEVVFLFVSVDGERDTPELLQSFMARYDPEFIGLSGTDALLADARSDFGLYYARIENPSAPQDYLVDHTASRFLIDKDGKLTRFYSFTTTPRAMARDIIGLLSQ